jgi:HD-GYP domain-containing protein (c-di-GMP phosphodiesterase class II)
MTTESEATALPVDLLRPGLYVDALDRPWVETPFLFQGFRIGADEEVNTLRRYCRRVFVNLERSDAGAARSVAERVRASADAEPSAPAPSVDLGERAQGAREVAGALFNAVPHPPRSHFARLVQAARAQREEARQAVTAVFRQALQNGCVDITDSNCAVAALGRLLADDPSAALWLMHLRQHEAYAGTHAVNACVLALHVGAHLGMSDERLHRLGLGALLMDVGKVRLPRELLAKKGPYSSDEFERMTRHVEYGCEILRASGAVPDEALEIVRLHHERRGSQGYPYGCGGDQIPRQALIAGLVDSYDAMISPRPYRAARRADEALKALYGNAALTFGTELVEAFIRCLGSFPVGTLVELDHGETAVVVGSHVGSGLWPTVLLLRTPDGEAYRKRLLLNFAHAGAAGSQVAARHIRRAVDPREANVDLHKVVAAEFGVAAH